MNGDQMIRRLDVARIQLFLFRQLPSELTERNFTNTYHMLEREYDWTLHVQNLGYPLP